MEFNGALKGFEAEKKLAELRQRLEQKLADRRQQPSVKSLMDGAANGTFPQFQPDKSAIEANIALPQFHPPMAANLHPNWQTPMAIPGAVPAEHPSVRSVASQPESAPEPYAAPKPEVDQELLSAQQARNDSQLLAGMGGAFEQIAAALGNRKADTSAYDKMAASASTPVEDLLQRRKASSDLLKQQQEQQLNDPNSPDNAAFRQFIQTKLPELAKSPHFNQLTLANPSLTKIADMWMKSEDRRLAAEANRLKQEEINGMRRSEEGRRMEQAMRPSDAQTAAVTVYNNLIDFGKKIKADKQNLSIDTGPVSNIQNAIAQKLGIDDSQKSVWRNEVQQQLADYVRSISGTASSDRERAVLLSVMPNASMNDQTFDRALDSFLQKASEFRENTIQGITAQGKYGERLRRPQDQQPIPAPSASQTQDPRIQQALDAGYTMEEIQAYLNGR